MQLTILGNNGPYPAAGGACSGYLLRSEQATVLIECGTGVLANLRAVCSPDRLDAVILSHLHYDHMSDMLPMQYALQFCPPRERLPVYAPAAPEAVRNLLDAPTFELKEICDMQIGDIRFSFMPVRHPVPSYALRAECGGRILVYTGDTNAVDGLAAFCSGADLLLADAGLSAADWRMESPHLSAAGCGQLAAEAGVQRLLLSHLNPKYAPEQLCAEAREAFDRVDCAYIGKSCVI